MMASHNRDRIKLLAHEASNLTSWRWSNAVAHISRTAPQWEPLALIEGGGTLVRNRQTGLLADHRHDRLVNINQRKAAAALDALGQE